MEKKKTKRQTRKEVGFVIEAKNYLYYLEGLPTVKVNDVIASEDGDRALVVGLDGGTVEALMLDRARPKPGAIFTRREEGLDLPPSDELLGRVINPLGVGLDGKGDVSSENGRSLELDVVAPGVNRRKLITDQLETGMAIIDTLVPVAKGQRELIFGEPRSGKTGFVIDILANQKDKDVLCIYAAIGKPEIELKKFVKGLMETGAITYTIVLGATSSEAAPVIYIAPSVAMGLADQFREQGKDVVVILDDLGKHAKYLREISLLAEHVPGRESYPGDIFYQHGHIVERAGGFNDAAGGGTVTLFPIIETDLENHTALIPTNVMSATDGHLLFAAKFRAEGRYPAVDIDGSVTRVGKQVQSLLHKVLGDKIRKMLADFEELRKFSRFGADVSDDTKKAIKQGQIMQEMVKQDSGQHIDVIDQMVYMALVFTTFFDDKDEEFIVKHKEVILYTIENDKDFEKMKEEVIENVTEIDLDNFLERIETVLPTLNEACHS